MVTQYDHCDPDMNAHFQQPLLFEMLRSFTVLAKHLNLSRAVTELNSTRQTVRRHIDQLDEIKGGPLFELKDRQYRLTELGDRVLPEAKDLLARADGWASGNYGQINGLQFLEYESPEGWSIYQQQHPLGCVLKDSDGLMSRVLRAWVLSGGQLEHEAMQDVRSSLMVFRRSENRWLCVELGEDCSYVSWFGWAKARSSVGTDLLGLLAGEGFGHLANLAYLEVEQTESVRLDHSFTQLWREVDQARVPVCFERLLLASKFPDQSFALISVARRTYDIEVKGVSEDMKHLMPRELLM